MSTQSKVRTYTLVSSIGKLVVELWDVLTSAVTGLRSRLPAEVVCLVTVSDVPTMNSTGTAEVGTSLCMWVGNTCTDMRRSYG